jgi:biotin carboxyl carrier protein
MKAFKFTINGNDYTVEVHGVEGTQAHLEVNGTPYDVEIHRKTKPTKTPTIVRPAIKAEIKPQISRKEGGSAHAILAPLPGNIMRLEVGKGDIVRKGDLLLMMEAMKMENKVLADRAGVVEKVLVGPGDSVLQGDVLIEIV